MPIFEIRDGKISSVTETSFGAEGIYERRDIQRLLRESIDVLGERMMVVAEEFGEWLDSSRRIDLLCLDTDANLVVIELKRTEDGGFMELQALRYAAMVSEMTFEQLVDTHARFRNRGQPDADAAKAAILQFLSWDDVSEDQFGNDVRIILAAADFGKELTTSVMWLNDRGIDVRCLRLKPYRLEGGPILLDIQQLIPLPEARSFQTQIGVKRRAERQGKVERHELRYQFWEGFLDYAKARTQIHANRRPTKDNWISGGIGRTGFSLSYVVRRFDCQVELWISLGAGQVAQNKAAFHSLLDQRDVIHEEFGTELEWQELSEGDGCRVRFRLDGGYKSPIDERPQIYEAMVTAMIRLDSVMRPRVHSLKLQPPAP